MSLRDYAVSTGRSLSTIQAYAKGYEIWSDRDGSVTLGEAIERANMGAETQAATAAVAFSLCWPSCR